MRDAQLGTTNVGGIQGMSIDMVHWHLQVSALGSESSAVKDVTTVLETLKEDLFSVLETLKEDLLSQLAMKDEGPACIGTSLSAGERQRTEAATAAGTKLAAAQGKLAQVREPEQVHSACCCWQWLHAGSNVGATLIQVAT